jgi:opacity protein-like surface antigen
MKRIVLLAFFIAGFMSAATAQEALRYEKPIILLNSEKGYITINEFTAGFGLGNTTAPYAKDFFGITTVHAYQISKNFIVGGGTGISFYNGGTLVPLFIDFRYRIYVSRVTPYVVADEGVFFDLSGNNDTRFYINPGAGVSYTIKPKLALSFGTGFLVQWGKVARDTYINMKTGVIYKF